MRITTKNYKTREIEALESIAKSLKVIAKVLKEGNLNVETRTHYSDIEGEDDGIW